MAFDREAAKAEGYSDDEINAYLQAEAEKNKQTAPAVDVGEPPAPQTKIEPVGTSAASVATTGALAAAPYIGTAALGAGGLYGAGLAKQAFDAYREGTAAKQAHTDLQYKKMEAAANRAAGNMPAQQMRPVSPTATYNVPTQNVPQMRAPLPTAAPVAPQPMPGVPSAGPVAPTAMPGMPTAAPAQTSPSIMNRMRALAANKVLQGAGSLAKGSVGPGMALYSGSLNTGEEEELRRRRMMPPTISR